MIDAATLVALLPLLAAETPPLLAPRDQASLLGRTIAERLLADPLDAIERQLHRAAERAPSDRMLPCVHALFSNPWSLPESAECIAGAANAPRSALAAARIAASALGAESPPEAGMGTRSIPSAYHALRHL
ncbi:MAG: hypothetical protein FJ253_06020, partial [Phycisphaerae bacterium]|nr:hypothetical protein [Phycisphaerae bacterium]